MPPLAPGELREIGQLKEAIREAKQERADLPQQNRDQREAGIRPQLLDEQLHGQQGALNVLLRRGGMTADVPELEG